MNQDRRPRAEGLDCNRADRDKRERCLSIDSIKQFVGTATSTVFQ